MAAVGEPVQIVASCSFDSLYRECIAGVEQLSAVEYSRHSSRFAVAAVEREVQTECR